MFERKKSIRPKSSRRLPELRMWRASRDWSPAAAIGAAARQHHDTVGNAMHQQVGSRGPRSLVRFQSLAPVHFQVELSEHALEKRNPAEDEAAGQKSEDHAKKGGAEKFHRL